MDPYPEHYREEEESLDIKKYLYQILYHWWWFALSIFIAMTIAYLVNRYSEEVYQVSSSVIVQDETQAGSVEDILNELSRVRNRKLKAVTENEISILKSYKLARMAVDELNFGITYTAVGRRGIAETQLYNRCPFVVKLDSSKNNTLYHPVNITILSDKKYQLDIFCRIKLKY